jgi:hypothetical protein
MAYTKKTKTPYIKMYIQGSYDSFDDFYDLHKKSIYENLVALFEGFKDSKNKILTLYIQAIIRGIEWDTEFKYNCDETIVLTKELIPYFESIEDYEKCHEIKLLHEHLINVKDLVII